MRTFAEKPKAIQLARASKTKYLRHSPEVNLILHPQRTIGNQAVQRLLQSNAEEQNTVVSTGPTSPYFRNDFSRIPISLPAAGPIQTKLAINKPGNEYEQEADRVAEQIMRMPEPRLQHACTCGGACQRCKAEQLGRKSERLRTKRAGVGDTEHASVPPVVHEVLESPGLPLDSTTRAFMESRFLRDFSQVRVHTDAHATKSARAVNALAFTVGHNIVFGAGQYRPSENTGKVLLAHELVHVAQQSYAQSESPPSRVTPNILHRTPIKLYRQPDAGVPDLDAGASSTARNDQIECVKRLGGCSNTRPAGIPTKEDISNYNAECRKETSYFGADVTPSEVECGAGPTSRQIMHVHMPNDPGWVPVRPTYFFFKYGEPFEFPHFLKVQQESVAGSRINVTALEGRYAGKDAYMNTGLLASSGSPKAAAKTKFNVAKGQFWYGSNGPINAKTDPTNPVPQGKHDIEIPDFHHKLGSQYGAYGTTWFRLGHSGDRYLHPGRVSLGCTTITATQEWPRIWKYLITSRKDDKSVGEHEVI